MSFFQSYIAGTVLEVQCCSKQENNMLLFEKWEISQVLRFVARHITSHRPLHLSYKNKESRYGVQWGPIPSLWFSREYLLLVRMR
jgi:hypothetical protein